MGVFGATSLVGQCLLPLLRQNGWQVQAYSRRAMTSVDPGISWIKLGKQNDSLETSAGGGAMVQHWIFVAPIWTLPDYFPLLAQSGVRRLVALSSTSRFTKNDSSDAYEKEIAFRLAESEDRLQSWAQSRGAQWVILRPTLIYGRGQDKNISEISRFVCRFGIFPLLGEAGGLRQPVHAEDVAFACLSALEKTSVRDRAYNISGGETLSYREMVIRIFAALNRRPRLMSVPLGLFRLPTALLRLFPRYRHWNVSMIDRMNRDLVFDHGDATRDLHFHPRAFHPAVRDLRPQQICGIRR